MKKRIITSIIISFCIILSYSCDDEFTSNVQTSIYQLPGCKSNSMFKSNETFGDSCFTYSFSDKLVIDFCVNGNCCPDSNRFYTTSDIFRDSISITIADTAQNLCRCMCNYIIHGEFESLPYDKYFVKCSIGKNGNQQLLYEQTVDRTKPN